MRLRAFAVCRSCAELYPSSRGCPACDRDEVAARQVAAARRPAALRPPHQRAAVDAPAPQISVARPRNRPLLAVLSLGLLFGAVLLVFLAQA